MVTDSVVQIEYKHSFKVVRVLGEIAGGIGMGVVGMMAGGLIGKGLSAGDTGEWAGFVEAIIGLYLGYCIGTAGGVSLVAGHYNSDVTFLSTFAASAGGAVAGIALVDWNSGGDWRASLPFVLPLVSSVLASEIFYQSRIAITIDRNNNPINNIPSDLKINFTIPLH